MNLLSFILLNQKDEMLSYISQNSLNKEDFLILKKYLIDYLKLSPQDAEGNNDLSQYIYLDLFTHLIYSRHFTQMDRNDLLVYLKEDNAFIPWDANVRSSINKVFFKNPYSAEFIEIIKVKAREQIQLCSSSLKHIEEKFNITNDSFISLMKKTYFSGGALSWLISTSMDYTVGTGLSNLDFFCENKKDVYLLLLEILQKTNLDNKIN